MTEEKVCMNCQRVFRSGQDFLNETSRWRMCSQEHLWFNCRCGSTLMMKKGSFSWYNPEIGLSDEAKGVFNYLGHLKNLPHLPNTLMEVQLELQAADVNPKKLAARVKNDPVIAAHVLQVAENLRKLRNPDNAAIRSLEHAIVYIGYKTFSDVLMSAGLRAMQLPPSKFDQELFWRESHLCGAIAEYLLKKLNIKLSADETFLSASLCNIGKLITTFAFPALASKIDHDIKSPTVLLPWRKIEKNYKFPDHCILGEIAAAFWGLPDYVMAAASKHHDMPMTKSVYPLTFQELAGFANQMTHWVLLQPHRIESDLLDAYRQRLQLSEAQLEALAVELIAMSKLIAA